MAIIYVVGLGPGDLSGLPMGTYQRLHSGLPLYFRTGIHPAVDGLKAEGLVFNSFDVLYEQGEEFEQIYDEMAEKLLDAAVHKGDIVYAVPGHPLMAEQSVQNLVRKTEERADIDVQIGFGQSFFDAVCTKLKIDPIEGLLLVDGTQISADQLRADKHLLIAQVYHPVVASEVKLTLMELFPDDYSVTVVRAAGVSGMERVEQVPLFELDRVDFIDHLTTVYVPPAASTDVLSGELWYTAGLVSRLRAPDGCPWDREQTHKSLRKYMLEEAYEVVHAIDSENPEELAKELGDVLLQILLHAEIASEFGDFTLREVFSSLGKKLIHRHPHVFGGVKAATAEEAEGYWMAAKRDETAEAEAEGVLNSVKWAAPNWQIARELQEKAAEVGFDWSMLEDVFSKLHEEVAELAAEIGKNHQDSLLNELGDVLFVIVNVARWLDLDVEQALDRANNKFVRRFGHVERRVKESGGWSGKSLEELDEYWNEAKGLEKDPQNLN
ncbi:nucleoside triphosphate pyrophosphohydrolase [Alicyclobacillus sp. SO9]|uniref:nucleoside triphosphate pyrophosphohydrolase n=1 Tax=Alicyclobacillus sp. SO9 TaxID=2665646 RepID=UPI0018E7B7F5|nr:nucleoside triphosphate pyrophosphohydrolase [Alicyclobacillus sp. SO9]QQE79412.1 nucleoside triphosphate pyrophosphohydrolase [Alicyclobacillus sp. SO9]